MEKGGMSGSLWLVCDTDSVAFSFYIQGGGNIGGGGNLFEKDVKPVMLTRNSTNTYDVQEIIS